MLAHEYAHGGQVLIVPVIDLREGKVVRTVGGRREHYRPLSSPLCPDAEPVAFLANLLLLYPFPCLYIADLDAIEDTGTGHRAMVERLLERFPGVTIWLDAGFSKWRQMAAWERHARLRPVLGSESQSSREGLVQLTRRCAEGRPLLSLDFRGARLLGPPDLLEDPSCWPPDVIVMDLDRVGQGTGIDSRRLDICGEHERGRRFYAAGGARHALDLLRLAAGGFAGALVATALHEGWLGAGEIRMLMGER
jgi:uncharacterized protein related to proFAR isomerase